MNKIYNFLESYTNPNLSTKFRRFIYTIFIPLFIILEYLVYRFFWKKIVIVEMLTNDEIVNFLDKNEFAYKGNKIYKQDLITSNEFFDRLNLDESKQVIKKEFVETISELLSKNIPLNIEEYITLIVNTEIKIIKGDDGENYRAKVYKK